MTKKMAKQLSEKALRRLLQSYHPVGVFRLLCSVLGDPCSPEKGVKRPFASST